MERFINFSAGHAISLLLSSLIAVGVFGCYCPGVTIEKGEMVYVPEGDFVMGRTDYGDDLSFGNSEEIPRHIVSLSSYQIGKYLVTNAQFVEALNWALCKGYLVSSSGGGVTNGDVYTYGKAIFQVIESNDVLRKISFNGRFFAVESPGGISRENHPLVGVSWYGAAAFCNWASEAHGFVPCYDLNTWQLLTPLPDGYRLPTEAEWERAAAWDDNLQKHWIYGYMGDEFDEMRCSCNMGLAYNPLQLYEMPYTTPVGYYNGANGTVDSPSPVGCYDMSGNVGQWCHDWFGRYDEFSNVDPFGPSSGFRHCSRGGSWADGYMMCRTASRIGTMAGGGMGLRIARHVTQ